METLNRLNLTDLIMASRAHANTTPLWPPPSTPRTRPRVRSCPGARGGAPEEFFCLYNAFFNKKTLPRRRSWPFGPWYTTCSQAPALRVSARHPGGSAPCSGCRRRAGLLRAVGSDTPASRRNASRSTRSVGARTSDYGLALHGAPVSPHTRPPYNGHGAMRCTHTKCRVLPAPRSPPAIRRHRQRAIP